MPRRGSLVSFLLALLLAVAAGCGSEERAAQPSAQRARDEAAGELERLRREVETRRERVAETEKAREAAEKEREAAEEAAAKAADAHAQALNALRDAEQRLASLTPPPPSDPEIFRRVQKELLDAPALARVAIRAEVADRKVTLQGTVPDEATRDAAVSIARGVDGVADVKSEIRVGAP